jgi:heat shock protein HslJ
MREWRLLGILLVTSFVAMGAGASGRDADSSSSESLTGTTWTLVAVGGREIDPSLPAVTLRFEADAILAGFDGCNRYRGAFSVDGPRIRIPGEMAMTRAACREPVARLSNVYLQALETAASYVIRNNRLSLNDANGDESLVFQAAGRTLAGTAWKVMAYNNGRQAVVGVLGGTRITARFGGGQVTGDAGCNRYFVAYQASDESVTIQRPAVTRRFCAEPEGVMDQEAAFLEALQSAVRFRMEGERLELRTSGGALALTLAQEVAEPSLHGSATDSKIRFDLDRLDADGLQGPPDGLRALHYEYCIPHRPEAIREVTAIDPSLQIQRGSPGRIGCGTHELLCLGHTHQPGFRAVLEQLAALPMVREIREAFFE